MDTLRISTNMVAPNFVQGKRDFRGVRLDYTRVNAVLQYSRQFSTISRRYHGLARRSIGQRESVCRAYSNGSGYKAGRRSHERSESIIRRVEFQRDRTRSGRFRHGPLNVLTLLNVTVVSENDEIRVRRGSFKPGKKERKPCRVRERSRV